MEQYIQDKKIIGVVELSEKTPANNDMVSVNFEDGTKETMPKMRFELIVSSKISNRGEVLEKLKARVGSIMFGTLHEFGIRWGEINPMIEALGALADNGYMKAQNIKWGVSDKNEISLIEINNVLLNNNAK